MKKPQINVMVEIDMVWSFCANVKADSIPDAKHKAFEKFKKKMKYSDFKFYADKID